MFLSLISKFVLKYFFSKQLQFWVHFYPLKVDKPVEKKWFARRVFQVKILQFEHEGMNQVVKCTFFLRSAACGKMFHL